MNQISLLLIINIMMSSAIISAVFFNLSSSSELSNKNGQVLDNLFSGKTSSKAATLSAQNQILLHQILNILKNNQTHS